MKTYTKDNLPEFARDLKKFIESGKPGDTVEIGLEPSMGIFDDVNYATIISHKTGKAVLIHAACSGDWTRAMLIPEEDFHYNSLCEVTEALEWHMSEHN